MLFLHYGRGLTLAVSHCAQNALASWTFAAVGVW